MTLVTAERVGLGPIIDQAMSASLGCNINGPSLIRRPGWIPGPGRYWLYFAHHKGRHIRLARADCLSGPWEIHEPGVLPLSATPYAQERPAIPQPDWAVALDQDGLYPHLASPDVLVDVRAGRLAMWVHGLDQSGEQVSYRAQSSDGLDWAITGPASPESYLRVFQVGEQTYAMARLGRLLRLEEDVFVPGPTPIDRTIRHCAVLLRGARLHVVYTCIGDAPERLCHTILDVSRPYPSWPVCAPETELLRPEQAWEGAEQPITPGRVGATGFTHALRDPALFEEQGQVWMIYAGGGEAALGLARLNGV